MQARQRPAADGERIGRRDRRILPAAAPLRSSSAAATGRQEPSSRPAARRPAPSFRLARDASWQADLFGGLRRSLQAARADEAAALFDLEGVRTSIAGEVATNYIDARLAQARLVIARSTLSTQDDNLQIAALAGAGGTGLRARRRASAGAARADGGQHPLSRNLLSAGRRAARHAHGPGARRAAQRDGDGAANPPWPRLHRNRHPRRHACAAARTCAAPNASSRRRRRGSALPRPRCFPALSISGNINTDAPSVGKLGSLLTGGLFAGTCPDDLRCRQAQVAGALGARRCRSRLRQLQADGACPGSRTSRMRPRRFERRKGAAGAARDRGRCVEQCRHLCAQPVPLGPHRLPEPAAKRAVAALRARPARVGAGRRGARAGPALSRARRRLAAGANQFIGNPA